MSINYRQDISRRTLILSGSSLLTAPLSAFGVSDSVLQIGLTPVFLDSRSGFLERWRKYLEDQLGQPVNFIQRRSYADILELLLNGQLSAAWLCGYPYVRYKSALQLLAVPIYQGAPTYTAYIITGPSAQQVRHFNELRAKVFAYSDPLSNSGFLFAQDQLHAIGEKDNRFFRKTFFAFGHQNVIAAVSDGLADAGSVDGYVWDSLNQINPDLTQQTRILTRSRKFGFPPFVAPKSRPNHEVVRLKKALLNMHSTSVGASLLRELNLDGFENGKTSLFAEIEAMMKRIKA